MLRLVGEATQSQRVTGAPAPAAAAEARPATLGGAGGPATIGAPFLMHARGCCFHMAAKCEVGCEPQHMSVLLETAEVLRRLPAVHSFMFSALPAAEAKASQAAAVGGGKPAASSKPAPSSKPTANGIAKLFGGVKLKAGGGKQAGVAAGEADADDSKAAGGLKAEASGTADAHGAKKAGTGKAEANIKAAANGRAAANGAAAASGKAVANGAAAGDKAAANGKPAVAGGKVEAGAAREAAPLTLLLFEEVDNLQAEDRGFMSALHDLLRTSKVCTCKTQLQLEVFTVNNNELAWKSGDRGFMSALHDLLRTSKVCTEFSFCVTKRVVSNISGGGQRLRVRAARPAARLQGAPGTYSLPM